MKIIPVILISMLSLSGYSQNDNFRDNLKLNAGLQFRSSINPADTINKVDFSLFVFQFGTEYDLLKENKLLSLSPSINGKLGFFFFLTTGLKSGLTLGINDKLKNSSPIGVQFSMNYDFNLNKFGKNTELYFGWCPESSLTIKVSEGTMLKLSYGLTLIPNNNQNFINNLTIGFTGLGDF